MHARRSAAAAECRGEGRGIVTGSSIHTNPAPFSSSLGWASWLGLGSLSGLGYGRLTFDQGSGASTRPRGRRLVSWSASEGPYSET